MSVAATDFTIQLQQSPDFSTINSEENDNYSEKSQVNFQCMTE